MDVGCECILLLLHYVHYCENMGKRRIQRDVCLSPVFDYRKMKLF